MRQEKHARLLRPTWPPWAVTARRGRTPRRTGRARRRQAGGRWTARRSGRGRRTRRGSARTPGRTGSTAIGLWPDPDSTEPGTGGGCLAGEPRHRRTARRATSGDDRSGHASCSHPPPESGGRDVRNTSRVPAGILRGGAAVTRRRAVADGRVSSLGIARGSLER